MCWSRGRGVQAAYPVGTGCKILGDELWPENRDAILATGLYCIGPALAESAMVANQLEYEWLTDATGVAFLGIGESDRKKLTAMNPLGE